MEEAAGFKTPLIATNNVINYQTESSEVRNSGADVDRARGLEIIRARRNILVGVGLSVLNVTHRVSSNITLPLFSQSVEGYSDPYFVIFSSSAWFPVIFWIPLLLGMICQYAHPRVKQQKLLLIGGILKGVNMLLIVYASDPNRTPPYLQAILRISVIPYTVLARYIILRKGVSKECLICIFAVLIGLLISLEPSIFNMDSPRENQEKQLSSSSSGVGNILWPLCFLLAFFPFGIMLVIFEKELKAEDSHPLTVVSWIHIYFFLTIASLFWTDFIPGFGKAKSASEFWDNLSTGYKCQYGAIEGCQTVVLRSWLYIISYCGVNLLNLMLIKFSSNAIYLVIIQAVSTPVSSVILKLFKSSPTTFEWNPVFDQSLVYLLVGLFIIVPAVIVYNILSEREKQRDIQE